MKAEFYQIDDY